MQRRISIRTLFSAATLAATILSFSLPSFAAPLIYNTDYYRAPAEGSTRIPRSSNAGAFVQSSSVPAGNISGNSLPGHVIGPPHVAYKWPLVRVGVGDSIRGPSGCGASVSGFDRPVANLCSGLGR